MISKLLAEHKKNMPSNTNIRPAVFNDLTYLKKIIDANDLFPSNMLDDMMSDYFNHENSSDLWFTYVKDRPVAIAYCAPERMTQGTWNLYLIAVHLDYQGQGIGTSMLQYIEQLLIERGEGLILVETSSLESFKRTQAFYLKCGYEKEALIRDFYQAGEDKIVFRKSLLDTK